MIKIIRWGISISYTHRPRALNIAKPIGVRQIIEANRIVKKTLEIIDYFKPKYWTIENPQTGLLKKQEFMEELPYFDIGYCKYGFNYRSELEFGLT